MEKLDPEIAEALRQLVQANTWWLNNQDSPKVALAQFSSAASHALSAVWDIESSLLDGDAAGKKFTITVDDAMLIVKANYSNLSEIERAFYANTQDGVEMNSRENAVMSTQQKKEVHPSVQQEIENTNLERSKWSPKQWYEHVGAWETTEGYISFGSVMAVGAMLIHFQRACLASQISRKGLELKLSLLASEVFEEAQRANKLAAEWGIAQITIAELRKEVTRLQIESQYKWNEGNDEHS